MLSVDGLLAQLWSSTSILRDSSYSPAETLPRHIPAFLLLKWLSDNSETLKATSVFNEFVVPSSVQWSEITRSYRNVGEAISRALIDLEHTNSNLSGLADGLGFSSYFRHQERDEILHGLTDWFTGIDLRIASASEPDVAARALSLFLDKVAGTWRSGSGTYATPSSVASLVIALANPKEGMRISDPATGWGGFLVTCARYVAQKTGKTLGVTPIELQLEGQERQPGAAAIAQVLLVLSGVPHARILIGDVLRQPALVDSGSEHPRLRQYDLVISHPPFGQRTWGVEAAHQDPFARFFIIPPQQASDFAFVQHALASLNEQGRAILILTPGALFRHGKEVSIREYIVRNNLLDAVIALPRNLFYDTGIAPVLLVFDRARGQHRNGTLLLVDATSQFESARPRNILLPHHIERIVSAYRAYREESGLAKLVGIDELQSRQWDLNVSTYFAAHDEKSLPEFGDEIGRAHAIEEERHAAAREIDDILSRLTQIRNYK